MTLSVVAGVLSETQAILLSAVEEIEQVKMAAGVAGEQKRRYPFENAFSLQTPAARTSARTSSSLFASAENRRPVLLNTTAEVFPDD